MSAGGTTLPEAVEAPRPPINIDALAHALETAKAPDEVRAIEKQLDLVERYMNDSGLYTADQVRRVNELRMRARWKLGKLLINYVRAAGPGRGKKVSTSETSFRATLENLGLDKTIAVRAQRIAALPEPEFDKALAVAHKEGFLPSFSFLLERARPYWYAASRKAKHQTIAAKATITATDERIGPFPLIYADPPWKFEIYSPKGLDSALEPSPIASRAGAARGSRPPTPTPVEPAEAHQFTDALGRDRHSQHDRPKPPQHG